jgi:hypothetical protein
MDIWSDSTGLSDLLFGTAVHCIRVLPVSSCNFGKHAAEHRIRIRRPPAVFTACYRRGVFNCVRLAVKAAAP